MKKDNKIQRKYNDLLGAIESEGLTHASTVKANSPYEGFQDMKARPRPESYYERRLSCVKYAVATGAAPDHILSIAQKFWEFVQGQESS